MLADENEVTCCGGQLVLLTGSTIHMDVAVSDEVTVHTIAFPSRTAFIDLGPVDGLQLAVDDDEDVESETSVTQSRLAAAFLQILRYGTADTPTQVREDDRSRKNKREKKRKSSPFTHKCFMARSRHLSDPISF